MSPSRGRAALLLFAAPLLALAAGGCTSEDAGSDVVVPSGSAPAPPASTRAPLTEPSPATSAAPPTPPATGDAGPPAGGTTLVVTTSAPEDAEERAVWDRYVEYWRENAAAASDTDRPLDGLSALMAEPLLTRTLDVLEAERADGTRYEGEVVISPTVLTATPGGAVVADCLDDSAQSGVAEDGSPVAGSQGRRLAVEAQLVQVPTGWVLTELAPGDDRWCDGDGG